MCGLVGVSMICVGMCITSRCVQFSEFCQCITEHFLLSCVVCFCCSTPPANGKHFAHKPVLCAPLLPSPNPLAAFPLVHECLLVGVSALATSMQVLFQITLVTGYSNEFKPCERGVTC